MKLLEKIMTYGLFNDGKMIGMQCLDDIQQKMYKHAPTFEYTYMLRNMLLRSLRRWLIALGQEKSGISHMEMR